MLVRARNKKSPLTLRGAGQKITIPAGAEVDVPDDVIDSIASREVGVKFLDGALERVTAKVPPPDPVSVRAGRKPMTQPAQAPKDTEAVQPRPAPRRDG